MAEGRLAELYVGLNGEGLLRKTTNGWDRFTMREGLADDHVWALHADEDKTLWIGTHGRGLSRFKDGRFFNFDQTGLPRVITCILEDDLGHLWFGSKRGLFRADRRKLNDFAEGRASAVEITHYDRVDGMGSSQCTGDRQPTAWKARDGRLWFATMGGVTVVDPRSLPLNQRPPPVAIEAVLIDDKAAPGAGDRIEVPPGGRRLEFRYAALSFTAPSKVRFQYRLEGLDENWIEANDRRAAHYTRVPPGSYRFQVIAANNDNVWNKTGASLAVVVQPYLWQTGWFRVLSAVLLVGAGAGLVRYSSVLRLRRRLANLERSHALERERVRISRDLHDNLGADLSQLALWSELAARETAQPVVMAERVRSVSSLAREVVQNVDEIVWAVNPRNDSLNRFSEYVCEFSERVITSAGLRFRWEAPDEIPAVPLPSDLRHNLFLATKEALNNVIKYAAATEARLHLQLVNGTFTLTISDNGRGFDEASAEASNGGGNGLRNMRERMEDCGGQLTVVSGPREGTTIRMTVPLPRRGTN
jgi:signal transduction histidine kinase